MELRHLRYFVAVAEELSFTRAASRLHTAQPSLSQQIRQLENEIGVPLFERTRHHVRLTAAGKLLLSDAQEIGIALVQADGAAVETVLAADVLSHDILTALDLLIHPLRLVATLRS